MAFFLSGRCRQVLFVLISAVVLMWSGSVSAQNSSTAEIDSWAIGPAGFGLLWTDEEASFDHLAGVGLQVAYINTDGIGFDFQGSYFFPSGFYGIRGLSGVLAVTYGIPTNVVPVLIETGAVGLAGGDSDGSVGAGAGPALGVGTALRLGRKVALQSDIQARLYITGDGTVFAPAASVALVWLFRGSAG
ncbi:MAG: hypothetical protein R3284_01715 [Rubricoccaceae bacterium]|nr:hypothetical protein [Rubricoccaceae bacterium]